LSAKLTLSGRLSASGVMPMRRIKRVSTNSVVAPLSTSARHVYVRWPTRTCPDRTSNPSAAVWDASAATDILSGVLLVIGDVAGTGGLQLLAPAALGIPWLVLLAGGLSLAAPSATGTVGTWAASCDAISGVFTCAVGCECTLGPSVRGPVDASWVEWASRVPTPLRGAYPPVKGWGPLEPTSFPVFSPLWAGACPEKGGAGSLTAAGAARFPVRGNEPQHPGGWRPGGAHPSVPALSPGRCQRGGCYKGQQ
jgi:hypothetical protein